MTIQWYPGHMEKARREAEEKLKLVDFVMELVDARAPMSSKNPLLEQLSKEKSKMIVFMKADLADQEETEKWTKYYREQGLVTVEVNIHNKNDIKNVIHKAKNLAEEKREQFKQKGVQPRAARAMIIGAPNVGKSALINRLAGKKIAEIGDRPGITKQQLWIKVGKSFELLDTPGILWPKFEEEIVGYRLGALGTIKDQLLPLEDISAFVITFLQQYYPKMLYERFAISQNEDDMENIFEMIGTQRGCLVSGGGVDFEKVASVILGDLRTGKLGRFTLESVEE